jgi:dTDP-glucose pyrophosphorylase
MDFGDIRKLVLSVDDEKLHEQTIEQLIKYMPNKEEMMQLLAYKDKMNDLSDAERFGVVVSKEGFEAD